MYHIKFHSVQMTPLQSQYLLCPPLACNTAWTLQQPNIATSGYFTWETGPWQHGKQHKMSQDSDKYWHSQKPSPWKRITRQTPLLWRGTETLYRVRPMLFTWYVTSLLWTLDYNRFCVSSFNIIWYLLC